MKSEQTKYGFTSERHQEVDAELASIERQITTLLAEYRSVAASTNRQGHTTLLLEGERRDFRLVDGMMGWSL